MLLGEATHVTAEFYTARAQITRRLIEQHHVRVVAVEADWPDAAAIDRYVTHCAAPTTRAFHRFPQWMWRNIEVAGFVEWLRAYNADRRPGDRVRFHGLDLYSLNASIAAVLDHLDRADPKAARVARERYGCLPPWQKDPAIYGRIANMGAALRCESAVLAVLDDLLARRLDAARQDGDTWLDAVQNARLVAAAESYYRALYRAAHDSWNLRDRHMFETLEHVLAARGPSAKAVVWAHNSHIGNAAATELGIERGELNIGQLCRERFGSDAALIGFGTDRGTVAAATDWDGAMEIKRVRPAHKDSYERLCRDAAVPRFLLPLADDAPAGLRDELLRPRLERAIGVIYRPESELLSHYFEASLPQQFDAYVWFEETIAVTPLAPVPATGLPDTYPFGL